MSTMEPIISVQGLSKCYRVKQNAPGGSAAPGWLRRQMGRLRGVPDQPDEAMRFWALRDVTFDLARGERLGIIGRNGAGKSTLLKIISRLVYPTAGEVRIRGRVTALLEVGTGMNENLTGRENIYLNASLHGMQRAQVNAQLDEIIDFSGLGDFIDEPVKSYSSGMRSRLGFSVAAHLDPDILLLDEVLAVGDIAFAQKCLRKVEGLTAGGRTVIFVSHSISDVVRFCDRGLWLEHGRGMMIGPVREVAESYAASMLGLVAEAKPASAPSVSAPPAAKADQAGPADPERPAVEIVAFRLVDEQGRAKATFLRQEPLAVQVRYRVLRDDLPLITSVHVHKEGVHVLSTHPKQPGRYPVDSIQEATVVIPARFLNTGNYQFSTAVVTPVRPILRHAKLDLAISCAVYDQLGEGDVFSGDYRGVVRPVLEWQHSTHAE